MFIGHNWGSEEILVQVIKDGSKYYETTLLPLSDKGEESQIQIKNFSFDLVAEPGEYTFTIFIKDQRGLTQLKSHALHDTKGKMLVL